MSDYTIRVILVRRRDAAGLRPQWSRWAKISVAGEDRVILRNASRLPPTLLSLPAVVWHVAPGGLLPVSAEEREALRRQMTYLGAPDLTTAELDDEVRIRRGDPSHDWMVWAAAPGLSRRKARDAYHRAATVDRTEQSYIVVRRDPHSDDGWLGFAGLGSHQRQAGGVHATRAEATAAASALVVPPRAAAQAVIRESLAGWRPDVAERLLAGGVPRVLRIIGGVQPMLPEIAVIDPGPGRDAWTSPTALRLADDEAASLAARHEALVSEYASVAGADPELIRLARTYVRLRGRRYTSTRWNIRCVMARAGVPRGLIRPVIDRLAAQP